MKFLDTDAIIEKTKSIIKDAKSYVYILSPYLQISDEIEALLLNTDKSYEPKEIKVVCRKDELKKEEYTKIQQIAWNSTNSIQLYSNQKLPAKIIYSSDEAVISSMNLYNASKENYEAGVYISNTEKDLLEKLEKFCQVVLEDSAKNRFDIRYYREENALSLYESLKQGNMIFFNEDLADEHGNITVRADAIRSAVTGKEFKGVMQLIVQQKLDAIKSEDKEILTDEQAGDKNLAENSPYFTLATFNNYDKKLHCYNYYPISSVINPFEILPEVWYKNTPYKKTKKKYKVQQHRHIIINAEDSDSADPCKYIAKYLAACSINATFTTNIHTLQKAKETLQMNFIHSLENGKSLTEAIYCFGEDVNKIRKSILHELHLNGELSDKE